MRARSGYNRAGMRRCNREREAGRRAFVLSVRRVVQPGESLESCVDLVEWQHRPRRSRGSLQLGSNLVGIVFGERQVAGRAVPTDYRHRVADFGRELARQHVESGPEIREPHTKRG